MAILQKKTKKAVLHATANTTWVIAGNSSVSNVANVDEHVYSGAIRQIWFGSPSGNSSYWTVKRGANVVMVVDSTGWIDFSGHGQAITQDASANVVVELTAAGDGSGYIMIEVSKNSNTGF